MFLLETVLEAGNVTIGTIGSPEPAYRMTTVPAAAQCSVQICRVRLDCAWESQDRCKGPELVCVEFTHIWAPQLSYRGLAPREVNASLRIHAWFQRSYPRLFRTGS